MSKNLSKRAVAASAKQAGALSLFHRAADELDAAAQEHYEISAEATRVANEHLDVVNEANRQGREAVDAAAKIRALIGASA